MRVKASAVTDSLVKSGETRERENAMGQILGAILVLFGFALIAAREWSAELHEKWNQRFSGTRWATGPRAMHVARVANLVVGIGLIILGLLWLVGALPASA